MTEHSMEMCFNIDKEIAKGLSILASDEYYNDVNHKLFVRVLGKTYFEVYYFHDVSSEDVSLLKELGWWPEVTPTGDKKWMVQISV